MTRYKVVYKRDPDGWWIARVSGVAGVHSNGRTIEEARRRVREALSLAVDDADSAELIDDIRLPNALRELVREQRSARSNALREQQRATALQSTAANRLADELNLSLRDIGSLLGLSHQMIKKLMVEAPRATTKQKRREPGGASIARESVADAPYKRSGVARAKTGQRATRSRGIK